MVQRRREQLVFAVVIFGLICRITQYLLDSSLWCDESFVALNVIHKSFSGLFGPLDWNEPAPPGFLVAEKLVVAILGPSEDALRLLPLVAGLAALLLFAPLARRICGDGPAMIWAVVLFAAWPTAIAQAGTLKHFSLDMLASIILLSLVPARQATVQPARLLLWGAFSASAVWLSFAGVFTVAGTDLVLAARILRGSPARQRIVLAIANLMVLISIAALAGPALAQRSSGLMGYWRTNHAFPDTSSVLGLALWLAHSLLSFCAYFWRAPGWIILPIAALGIATFWQAGMHDTTLMLLVPMVLALAASFAHVWPFGGNQHMSFAAPAMLLIIGQGCETIRRELSRRRRWLGEAALAALIAPVFLNSAYRAIFPRPNSDLRSVVEFFQQHRLPHDAVIVSDPATVDYYAGHDFRFESPPVARSGRVWFISIPGVKPGWLDSVLDRRPLLARAESDGAQACLFGPQAAGPERTQH